MQMFFKVGLLFWLLSVGNIDYGYSQSIGNYQSVINKFYSGLKGDSVTIEDYTNLFGPYAIEEEEFYFYKDCIEGVSICDQKAALALLSKKSRYLSPTWKRILHNKQDLLQGEAVLDIRKGVDRLKILEHPRPQRSDIIVSYKNGFKVYFVMIHYKNEPMYIGDVYLPNGKSIFNGMETRSNNEYETIAIIKDPDGYSNIRNGAGVNQEVISKINENTPFLVYPTSLKNWWKVKTYGDCITGYIHKSRVIFYGNLDEQSRNEIDAKKEKVLQWSCD